MTESTWSCRNQPRQPYCSLPKSIYFRVQAIHETSCCSTGMQALLQWKLPLVFFVSNPILIGWKHLCSTTTTPMFHLLRVHTQDSWVPLEFLADNIPTSVSDSDGPNEIAPFHVDVGCEKSFSEQRVEQVPFKIQDSHYFVPPVPLPIPLDSITTLLVGIYKQKIQSRYSYRAHETYR